MCKIGEHVPIVTIWKFISQALGKTKECIIFIPLCQNLGFMIIHVFTFVIIYANI
jgi:hypothetical protein